ncbi:MAG: hypothetical protein K0Q74_827 [Gammaproteobacteria bacterium]|jgi:hypothetical protein|nr:hypothetical protein [Gammaproteobacteria bacterium]
MNRLYQLIVLFLSLFFFSLSMANGDSASGAVQSGYTEYNPARHTPPPIKQKQPKPATRTQSAKSGQHKTAPSTQPTKVSHYKSKPVKSVTQRPIQQASSGEIIESSRELPYFSAINASDDVVVFVQGGKPQSVIVRSNDARAVQAISTTVSNQTLYIKRARPTNGREVVTHITLPFLSGIYAKGTSQVIAKNIRTQGLALRAENNAVVEVEGKDLILSSMQNNSTQNLVVSGIHARNMDLTGVGRGDFVLSGKVSVLTARLYGGSRLYAEGLKADDVYVRAEDNALAIVTPIKALYGFAFGNSNVYYCKTPPKLVIRTEGSGNVLKVP